MRKRGQGWSFDSRDLLRSRCSHCTRLAAGRELGVSGLGPLLALYQHTPDNLAIRYGIRFEEKLEQDLVSSLGDLVAQPENREFQSTLDLMDKGMPVIYQGVLRGGSGAMEFSGRPDFLLRSDWRFLFEDGHLTARQVDGWSGGYTAWDAKLSSSAKPEYQNQVALYVDVLTELGLSADQNHGLILGSHEIATFDSASLLHPMLIERTKFLEEVFKVIDKTPQRIEDLGELVCEASTYCDLCEYPDLCQDQRKELNHLQLVAGITKANIESLSKAGVKTVAQLAKLQTGVEKLTQAQVEKLSRQARLQQHTYDTGENVIEVIDSEILEALPAPNRGDLFFDLEGFTYFSEPGGIEYLFGFTSVDKEEKFHWLWADTREEEKQSFDKFMHDLLNRVQAFPEMKIYHYASYEQVALKRLADRYGIYQTAVAELLEGGYFVDLYKVVKSSIMVSQEGYSIKQLENYYSFQRVSDVKEAKGSMDAYDQYLTALTENPASAEVIKRQVIAYNQDDCASTLALYRWLRSLVNRNV